MVDHSIEEKFNQLSKKLGDFFKEVLGPDLPHASTMMTMIMGDHEHPNASFDGELSGKDNTRRVAKNTLPNEEKCQVGRKVRLRYSTQSDLVEVLEIY